MKKGLLIAAVVFLLLAGLIFAGGVLAAISVDSTFSAPSGYVQFKPVTATTATIYSSVIQADGKIVVAGSAAISGFTDSVVARLNADGTLDSGFGSSGFAIVSKSGNDSFYTVAVQTDGKIIAAGTWSASGSMVVRFNTDGSLDTTFGSAGYAYYSGVFEIYAVTLQADGKIVLSGSELKAGGENAFKLLRINANGSLDSGFGSVGVFTLQYVDMSRGQSIRLQTDSKIIVAGMGNAKGKIIRVNTNGTLDTTFGSSGYYTLLTAYMLAGVSIQTDGKIVSVVNESSTVLRLNADGTIDTSFGSSGYLNTLVSGLYSSAIQADGKIVATGFSAGTYAAVRRLNINGAIDSTGSYSFPLTPTEGKSIQLQPDGKVLVAGNISGQMLVFRLSEGQPDISISPALYDFGNVVQGSTSTAQTFTVTNIGTANLFISAVTLSGANAAEFGKQTDTCSQQTIPAQGSCSVGIVFMPSSLGNKSANLVIQSNDPDTPSLSAALSGTGVLQQYTLTVSKAGTGTGIVTATGINCGLDCSENYNAGTVVTLNASADVSSTFSGWSGGGCTGTGQCVITINANTTVTATFTQQQTQTYTITTSTNPAAGGSVSCNPNPVNSGAQSTCTITTNAGYTASAGGTCGGTLNGNTYTTNAITSNCTVEAAFTATQQCTFSINPTSQNFTSSAGSGSVSVTAGAGCNWTAASNAAWITVTSGAAGTGNGTVNYSATANTGAARTGIVTIAGQTFTVTQEAANTGTANLFVVPTSLNFIVTVGQSQSQVVTIINSGAAAAGFTSKTLASGKEYIAMSGCGLSLAAGSQCTITVTYAPAAAGTHTDTLTISADGKTFTVSLSGTATAAQIQNHNLDDTDDSVNYGENCFRLYDTRAHNGSYMKCANYGGIAGEIEIRFEGFYISVLGSLSRYGGEAYVFLDGEYKGIISTYHSADELFQQSIFTDETTQGSHTLYMVPKSSILGRGITIDGFVIKTQ